MLQKILKWIASAIVKFLDPTYEKELEEYQEKRREQLRQIESLKGEIFAGEQRIQEIQVEREGIKAELAQVALRLDELEKKRNEIKHKEQVLLDALPLSDHVHVDLGDV